MIVPQDPPPSASGAALEPTDPLAHDAALLFAAAHGVAVDLRGTFAARALKLAISERRTVTDACQREYLLTWRPR